MWITVTFSTNLITTLCYVCVSLSVGPFLSLSDPVYLSLSVLSLPSFLSPSLSLCSFHPSFRPSLCLFLTPSLPSWISVLTNSKEEALNMAFQGGGAQSTAGDSSMEELTRSVIEEVLRMPGNDSCCDCGAPGWPTLLTLSRFECSC